MSSFAHQGRMPCSNITHIRNLPCFCLCTCPLMFNLAFYLSWQSAKASWNMHITGRSIVACVLKGREKCFPVATVIRPRDITAAVIGGMPEHVTWRELSKYRTLVMLAFHVEKYQFHVLAHRNITWCWYVLLVQVKVDVQIGRAL